jgi:hypothetical protein
MVKPYCIAASHEKIQPFNAYLLDNGEYIYLYICSQVGD